MPEPTVKQALCLSRTRTGVRKKPVRARLIATYRMNELGYDPYWQRFMCMNWDDFDGCAAGCKDCDSLHRVPPHTPAILRAMWGYLL